VETVVDDQTIADIPESELSLLPVDPRFKIADRMATWARECDKHKRRKGNVLMVQQVLERLHASREVAAELGHQMRACEADAILANWAKHGRPMRPAEMFSIAPTWNAPWWLVCLNCGIDEMRGKRPGNGKANGNGNGDYERRYPTPDEALPPGWRERMDGAHVATA
jgi:hypothetical protein